MHRRVLCVALHEMRIELASERANPAKSVGGASAQNASDADRASRPSPLAVVVARPGGAVKTERDVLGATKIDVVSREARAYGARAGQTVAAARAKCSELRVCVVREDEVRSGLERVAEVALAFGPSAAIDVVDDVVWVEVGGCAHLHGGERELANAVDTKVRALGHVCRIAIADGPRIASAVARFGHATRQRGAVGASESPLIVPEGKGAAAMRVLPLAVLDLDDDSVAWLDGLGLRTCGALQKQPRRALGTRLGSRAHEVMQLLDGEDRAPLDVWRPPEIPEERATLEWGASSVEALAFVVKALCDRLSVRLESRAVAATRVDLVLDLDRALCGGAGALFSVEPRCTFGLVLPSPVARAADLFAVVRARLERETLAAPALAVTLRASEMASVSGRTLDLLAPEPKADRALPRLVAEIAAELGESRVGTLELVDTWSPDRRTRLVPFGTARATTHHSLLTTALEPSRLVCGGAVPASALDDADLLVRIEAVEWWRRECGTISTTDVAREDSRPLASSRTVDRDGPSRPMARHDWFAAWTPHAEVHALAWVERVSGNWASLSTPEPRRTDGTDRASSSKTRARAEVRSGAFDDTDEVHLRGWVD